MYMGTVMELICACDSGKNGARPAGGMEQADQVLCSHGHGGHCGTEGVTLRQGAAPLFVCCSVL